MGTLCTEEQCECDDRHGVNQKEWVEARHDGGRKGIKNTSILIELAKESCELPYGSGYE